MGDPSSIHVNDGRDGTRRYTRLRRLSVGVAGDDLRDPERQGDLERGEERETRDDQQNRVPRHALCRLAFGGETGFVDPLFSPMEQAVVRLRVVAFRVAQRCARSHASVLPVRPQP